MAGALVASIRIHAAHVWRQFAAATTASPSADRASPIRGGRARRPIEAAGRSVRGALSARESDVLHFLVDGLPIKQVASRLDITPRTAENQRSRVLAKLNLRNSAKLVRYALRKRLVT